LTLTRCKGVAEFGSYWREPTSNDTDFLIWAQIKDYGALERTAFAPLAPIGRNSGGTAGDDKYQRQQPRSRAPQISLQWSHAFL